MAGKLGDALGLVSALERSCRGENDFDPEQAVLRGLVLGQSLRLSESSCPEPEASALDEVIVS